MKEVMDQELAEAIATLEKANSALSRIFNTEEGECKICANNIPFCADCQEGEGEDDE
jgi:hypothetical protein